MVNKMKEQLKRIADVLEKLYDYNLSQKEQEEKKKDLGYGFCSCGNAGIVPNYCSPYNTTFCAECWTKLNGGKYPK